MTRARPLPPEERRAMIVAAARPLIAQEGESVTTAQIAAAAGLAEGTLFRVFPTKTDIVCAVVDDILDPTDLIAQVQAAAGERQDLDQFVLDVTRALRGSFEEATALFAALFADPQDRRHRHEHHARQHARGHESQQRVIDAIAAGLAPHAASLSTAPETAASLLISLVMVSVHHHSRGIALNDAEELGHLFLHGVHRKATA